MTALITVICVEFHIHSFSFQSCCTSNRVAEASRTLVKMRKLVPAFCRFVDTYTLTEKYNNSQLNSFLFKIPQGQSPKKIIHISSKVGILPKAMNNNDHKASKLNNLLIKSCEVFFKLPPQNKEGEMKYL